MFRDVVIALANEFADYCRAESIDINEVTDCAKQQSGTSMMSVQAWLEVIASV